MRVKFSARICRKSFRQMVISSSGSVATTVAEGDSARWQSGAVDFYQKRNYGPEKVARAILKAVRCNRAVVPVSS